MYNAKKAIATAPCRSTGISKREPQSVGFGLCAAWLTERSNRSKRSKRTLRLFMQQILVAGLDFGRTISAYEYADSQVPQPPKRGQTRSLPALPTRW